MKNKRELFRHVAFRHLREFKSFMVTDSDECNKLEYRAMALHIIQDLWLYDYVTRNTRDLLETWLYSI